MIINVYWSVVVTKTRYSRQMLKKFEFCRYICEKYSHTKFHENPISGSRDVRCGRADSQTDIHDKTNTRFFEILRKRLQRMTGFDMFNNFKTNGRMLYLKTQFVPRSKHFSSRL